MLKRHFGNQVVRFANPSDIMERVNLHNTGNILRERDNNNCLLRTPISGVGVLSIGRHILQKQQPHRAGVGNLRKLL